MYIPDIETEEREALRDMVRDLIGTGTGSSDVRRAIASANGFDAEFWRIASDVGLPALAIAEEFGGSGGTIGDQAIAFQELGKALIPSPLLASTALAAPLIAALGDDAASADHLPRIADGSLTATVALYTEAGGWTAETEPIGAESGDDGWTLSGVRRFVLDGATAGLIIVPTVTAKGPTVFAVEAGSAGLTIAPRESLDLTRRLADITFDGVAARLIGEEGTAQAAIETAVERGILALVAEQTGAAEHLTGLAVTHAKTRIQFGRLIGEFQAIKHKLADVAFDLERMKSVLARLVEESESDSPELAVTTHLAKAYASEALFRIAAETIQVLGGIGFTWEHEAHLYFRRAKSSEVLLGQPYEHREAMLRLLETGS
ncbi:MAG: acyl-CoA dehydrogenase family protein [Aeromicrobium sp.]